MANVIAISPAKMAANASQAAALMKALSNEHRLLILCHLIAAEEMSVGELVERIALSQSALSQHLAKLREEGLVSFRRHAQTLFYSVSDNRAADVLLLLHEMFCAEPHGTKVRKSPMVPSPSRPDKDPGGD